MFAPLRNRVFAWLWVGVVASSIGTFAQTVGAQWLFIQDPSAATIAAGVAAAVHRQRAARAVSARAALGGA